MSTEQTYLAVFLGSADSPQMRAWAALSDADRAARQQQGMAAWEAWGEANRDRIVEIGGPLGRTKRISADGIADVRNALTAFSVVRAASHEDAARLFENHPHFAIFPGEAVEVMPILPIPGR